MSALKKWRVTTVFDDLGVQSGEFLWENPTDLGAELSDILFNQRLEANGRKIATIIIQPVPTKLQNQP